MIDPRLGPDFRDEMTFDDLVRKQDHRARIVDDICASHHKGNQESAAANRTVAKASQRKRILYILQNFPTTCDDIEDTTGLSHQSCSARISELKRDGLIRKIGTRKTRSGCNAAVYQAV